MNKSVFSLDLKEDREDEFEISGKRVPNHRSLVAERPVPERFQFLTWNPEKPVIAQSEQSADIYPALQRDTEAENHQSVEKQVLHVCSQCVFESEASVVA